MAGVNKFKNTWKDIAEKHTTNVTHDILELGKEMNTSSAGPVPNSLLAEQDLETTKNYCPNCGLPAGMYIVRFDQQNFVVSNKNQNTCKTCKNDLSKSSLSADDEQDLYEEAVSMLRRGMSVARIAATLGPKYGCSERDAQQIVQSAEYNNKSMNKGVVEQTGKMLETLKDEAEDVDTKKEKSDLVEHIKAVQLKRQSAIINQREKSMSKTFKDGWKGLNKAGEVYNREPVYLIIDETGREVATYGTSRKMAEDAIQRLGNKLGHKYKIVEKKYE